MNHHGTAARLHWSRYLPASYHELEDPDRFFTNLGEQAAAQIEDLYLTYSEAEVPGESAEDKEARLTGAMSRATEEVYAELVTPSPASQGEPDPEDEETPPAT